MTSASRSVGGWAAQDMSETSSLTSGQAHGLARALGARRQRARGGFHLPQSTPSSSAGRVVDTEVLAGKGIAVSIF